jgi:hypothetical protein
MAVTCTVSGVWNNVLQTTVVPSVNEFQTESLAIFAQIINNLTGSSLPIPTAIPSDNEYRAGALAALCAIAQNLSGGVGLPYLHGNGSPQGIQAGSPGQRYHDDLNGGFYTNTDGTVNGWEVG